MDLKRKKHFNETVYFNKQDERRFRKQKRQRQIRMLKTFFSEVFLVALLTFATGIFFYGLGCFVVLVIGFFTN